uniref:RGS domain-containing protein n=1 Tax=Macrostomum lignano TaxID=282301 RepID=A0A1I8GDD8_9PLAT
PDSVVPPSSIIRTLIRSLVPPQTAPGGQVLWLKQIGCPLSEATLQAYLQSSDSYEFLAAERASFSDWHNRMCLQYLEQMAKTPPSLLALPLPIMSLSVGRQSQAYQQAPVGAEVSMETTQSQPTPPSLTAASSPAVSSRGTGSDPAGCGPASTRSWSCLCCRPGSRRIRTPAVSSWTATGTRLTRI